MPTCRPRGPRRFRTLAHAAARILPAGLPAQERGAAPTRGPAGPLAVALALVLGSLLFGCGGDEGGERTMRGQSGRGELLAAPDGAVPDDAADFGRPAADPADAAAEADAIEAEPDFIRRSSWGVLLGTYRGPEATAAAVNQINQMAAALDPRLADARVHPTRGGALVVYGRYRSVDDARAQADLKWIKALERGGRTVFPRAILTRTIDPQEQGSIRPIELLSVRQRLPNTNPLYTLQIAAWGTFGDRGVSYEEVARRAEAEVRRLRAQNLEAYVHHDPDLEVSSITIGIFGAGAVDVQAGMEVDPRLAQLRRRFPAHLVNGEELLEPVNPLRPEAGMRPQAPRLVEVPRGR